MSRPPCMQSKFFSSLKQVEKRLKLENASYSTDHCSPAPAPKGSSLPVEEGNTESLVSSPLYLHIDHQSEQCSALEDSEVPREFLSMSNDFLTAQEEPVPHKSPENQPEVLGRIGKNESVINDIQLLLNILHLPSLGQEKEDASNKEEKEGRPAQDEKQSWASSDLENVMDAGKDNCFYADLCGKFTTAKGPKCRMELERLDGWIRHYGNGGKDCLEPLRLAHLLLGKAALTSVDVDSGFEGLEFPLTIDYFLQNDPPTR